LLGRRPSTSVVSTRPPLRAGVLRLKNDTIPPARYCRSARSMLLLEIPNALIASEERQAPESTSCEIVSLKERRSPARCR